MNNRVYEQGIGISCYWELELIDAATGKVKQRVEYHQNTILNCGLQDRVAQTEPFNQLYNYIAVGSGTSSPTDTQTGLETEIELPLDSYSNRPPKAVDSVFSTFTANESDPTAPYIIFGTQFGVDECNATIHECGLYRIAWDAQYQQYDLYFCRDLIKDQDGIITAITKTNADLLTIKCKLIMKRTQETLLSNVVSDNKSGSYTCNRMITNRGLSFALTSHWWDGTQAYIYLGSDNFTDPTATQINVIVQESLTITGQGWGDHYNYYRDFTMVFTTQQANIAGGIGEMYWENSYYSGHSFPLAFRATFTPKLPKDENKQLTLVWRYTISRG